MLDGYHKLEMDDVTGHNNVTIESGFNSKEPSLVKITIGDKEAQIKLQDLYSFVFIFGSPEMQEKLIPHRSVTVEKTVKWHRVKVTKPLKPGDYLNVRCETNIPTEILDTFKGWGGAQPIKGTYPIIGQK